MNPYEKKVNFAFIKKETFLSTNKMLEFQFCVVRNINGLFFLTEQPYICEYVISLSDKIEKDEINVTVTNFLQAPYTG